jgi:hypothetical protein
MVLKLASGINIVESGSERRKRMWVDSSPFLRGGSEVSRSRGFLASRQGTGTRTPRGRKRHKKAQVIERYRGLEPDALPLMAGMRRCCPAPRVLKYIFDSVG